MSLKSKMLSGFYERAVKDKSYEDLLQKLERNKSTTHSRMLHATGSSYNRRTASHVIGIERWSAHRLRALLGEPLVIDEYDGYAPSRDLSMAELAAEFEQTRDATEALVRELQSKEVPLTKTVLHNEVGELSLAGWIFYIENHTGRETVLLMRRWHGKSEHAGESKSGVEGTHV